MTEKIVPHETGRGTPRKRRRTDSNPARKLTLAKSYDEEGDEIMKWADWYERRGNMKAYLHHMAMAEARYAHAKKLRNEP